MPSGPHLPTIYPSIKIFDFPLRTVVVFLLVMSFILFLFLGVIKKSVAYILISILSLIFLVAFFWLLIFLAA